MPIPSKWHIRVLPSLPFESIDAADAGNVRYIREISRHVQKILQVNIDQMLARRKSWFRGRVLDGAAPAAPPFPTLPPASGDPS